MNPKLHAAVAEFQRVKTTLLAGHPELKEDERALADTLDGETSLQDEIAKLIRWSREDDGRAKQLGEMIDELCERKRRFKARAEAHKAAALHLMQAANLSRLVRPDFTASLTRPRPAVLITDDAAVPDELCRIKREPNKTAIREAIESGKQIPGCALGNSPESLVVRVK